MQRQWETLADLDPMWAVLTDQSKLGRKWSEGEFFESGSREIGDLMVTLDRLAPGASRERALDFGCGIGRLSRALAGYYGQVDAVDVAPSMISLGRELNAHPERCTFHLNAASDLRLFADESFDLIYSNIVLQHMQPALALKYVSEFARCAKRGGLVVFQVPHRRRLNSASLRRFATHAVYTLLPAWLVQRYRRKKYKDAESYLIERLPKVPMEMHALPQKAIEKVLGERFRLLAAVDPYAKTDAFESRQYYFLKLG